MKASFNQKIISWVAAWAMVFAPVVPAYAQTATTTASPAGPLDFNTYCSPAAIAADPTASSDQTSAYCAQASIAQTAIKFQTEKELLMMAAGASMTVLAFVPLGAGSACTIDSNVADAGGLALDVTQALKTGDISSSMMSGISTLGAGAIANGLIMKGAAASLDKQLGKTAVGKSINNSVSNSQCLIDAGLAFAQGAVSMISVAQQKKAEQSALQSVAAIVNSRAPGTSSFNLTGNSVPTSAGSSGTAANAVAGAATAASGTCAGSTSNSAYLSCLSQGDPVSAALTANPNTMGALDQALGQPAAAFVQGYNGDGSPASVAGAIGSAMGMSPTGTAALQKAIDTSADLASKGDYKPATYIASAAPVSAPAADTDFSKMMSGMMSKLAPESKTGEDPSTIVYRQLDLLPASKIEANKDISIFARIGYRYRKSSSQVEQLNWANPANQTVNNTPINSADSNTRAPASKN